jgi:hypothetical protein
MLVVAYKEQIILLDKDDNDNDAQDEQTIWKAWDRSDNSKERASDGLAEGKVETTSTNNAAANNYNSLVSTADRYIQAIHVSNWV